MEYWKKCSTCKKEVIFQARYYICSVSSCNSKRTGYIFCSIPCFDSHVPGARHKSAGAIEMKSPARVKEEERSPQRRMVPAQGVKKSVVSQTSSSSNEVLIVASRLKDFIQSESEFNTSSTVMGPLSDHIRIISRRAIDNARADGRKTVMDRDFKFLNKLS